MNKTPFDKLLDSLPRDERESLLKITRQLNINDNDDPMFKILLALEYYRKLYGDIPAQIANASEKEKEKIIASINKDVNKAHDKAIEKIAEKVGDKAIDIIEMSHTKTIAITVIICVSIISGFLWLGSQWLEKQNREYAKLTEISYQKQYLNAYHRWVSETTKNIKILQAYPEIQEFVIDNIEKIQWLKTSQGKKMWNINQFYTGSNQNKPAEYPCIKYLENKWKLEDKPIITCEIALRYK